MADVYDSDDPGEDIANALVAYVNGLRDAEGSPLGSVKCEARNPPDPSKELELEHQTIQVLFFPVSEEEEKIGRGGQVAETYGVSMLVVRQISVEFTRQVLCKFVRRLKKEIRGVRMAGYVYSTGETVSKFDPERINRQFVSAVTLFYRGTA